MTDYLKQDPPVIIETDKPTYEQKWAVMSFISPEDQIKQRFIIESNEFLYNDINKQLIDTTTNIVRNTNQRLLDNLQTQLTKLSTSNEELYKQVSQLLTTVQQSLILDEDVEVAKVMRTYKLDKQDITDRFELYKTENQKELDNMVNQQLDNRSSVCGVKVRGCYEDLEKARARAKQMRDEVEPAIHAFVAPVGYWCPWDPSADSIQDQDYMNKELNNLMEQKLRNAQQRDEFFKKRKDMLQKQSEVSKEEQLKQKLKEKLKLQQQKRNGK